MRRLHLGRVGAVLAVGVIGLIGVVEPVGAVSTTKAAKPTLTDFYVTPTSLYSTGGTVTMTADVTNATSCTFVSKPAVANPPATVGCSDGSVTENITLPADAGKKAVKYEIYLSVKGSKVVKSKTATVTVGTATSGEADLTGVESATQSSGGGYCALLSGGGVDCWGENSLGQLGNGTLEGTACGGLCDDVPQAVSGITNAVSVTGECALLATGSIDCWGYNPDGEIGNGTIGGPDGEEGYDTPQGVSGITDAIALGGDTDTNCAVLATGQVECWGDNAFGTIGNGSIGGPDGQAGYDTPQPVPGINDAVAISDGGGVFCVLLTTGGIDCWGDNTYGELGNGTVGGPDGEEGYDSPQAVSGISGATSIVSNPGEGFCAILGTDGVDCWGLNDSGQIGNGFVGGPDDCYGHQLCFDTPQPVTGLDDVMAMTTASGSYCAVLSSGVVDCWGDNTYGALGIGSTGGPDGANGFATPQPVMGITDATTVTSTVGGTYCAVLATGGVDCWGDNGRGELGIGSVGGPDGAGGYDSPQAALFSTPVSSMTSDSDGFCAVLTDGGMSCWGLSEQAELGNGSTSGPDGQGGYDLPQPVVATTSG